MTTNPTTDMRPAIVPKSDQLNADDLIGGPRTIKITKVSCAPGTEQPVSINFEGDGNKPWKPCKSMLRVLVQIAGPDGAKWVGISATLFRDPSVTWGGLAVGGIRISHISGINAPVTMALTATKKSRAAFTVQPLKIAEALPVDLAVVAAGDAAAAKGVADYTTWASTLTPEVKATVRHLHPAWSATAKAKDAAALPTPSEPAAAAPEAPAETTPAAEPAKEPNANDPF